MNTVQDFSFGIVPIHKNMGGNYLFCIVKQADGHWSFPKGHKEGEEKAEQTAQREFYEEVGVKNVKLIPDVSFMESYVFEHEEVLHEKTVEYFLGITTTMESAAHKAPKGEISEIAWLPYAELIKQLTFPESKKVAHDAQAYVEQNLHFI